MKNNKYNIVKNSSVTIVAAVSSLASGIDVKQNTIDTLKEFEASKPAAMQSLIEKLNAIEVKNSVLDSVKNVAVNVIEKNKQNEITEDTVYLKPQQSHGSGRDSMGV
jgi:hypothetical protein